MSTTETYRRVWWIRTENVVIPVSRLAGSAVNLRAALEYEKSSPSTMPSNSNGEASNIAGEVRTKRLAVTPNNVDDRLLISTSPSEPVAEAKTISRNATDSKTTGS